VNAGRAEGKKVHTGRRAGGRNCILRQHEKGAKEFKEQKRGLEGGRRGDERWEFELTQKEMWESMDEGAKTPKLEHQERQRQPGIVVRRHSEVGGSM